VSQLNTDIIATAAFGVLDERGIPGFTMRAVAEALSVTPMALYNHVPDKAGLAALIVNAAIDQHPLSAPVGDWHEDLWAIARWMREGTRRHPALQELQQAYRIWTPAVCDIAERWVSLWRHSGLGLDQALLAASTSGLAISGLVDRESMYCDWAPPDQAILTSMPNAHLFYWADFDPAQKFELGVRSIIEGLHSQLSTGSGQQIIARAPN
jgi:AcrR family transcriptional regulator